MTGTREAPGVTQGLLPPLPLLPAVPPPALRGRGTTVYPSAPAGGLLGEASTLAGGHPGWQPAPSGFPVPEPPDKHPATAGAGEIEPSGLRREAAVGCVQKAGAGGAWRLVPRAKREARPSGLCLSCPHPAVTQSPSWPAGAPQLNLANEPGSPGLCWRARHPLQSHRSSANGPTNSHSHPGPPLPTPGAPPIPHRRARDSRKRCPVGEGEPLGWPPGLLSPHGPGDSWSHLEPGHERQLQLRPGGPGGLSSESCMQTARATHAQGATRAEDRGWPTGSGMHGSPPICYFSGTPLGSASGTLPDPEHRVAGGELPLLRPPAYKWDGCHQSLGGRLSEQFPKAPAQPPLT